MSVTVRARLGNEAPEHVKYLDRTDREIPVVRLRRSVVPAP